MAWEKRNAAKIIPFYYANKKGNVTVELTPPYESDPWFVKMYNGTELMIKESFRFRGKDRYGKPESLDDLEKAKEKAFQIAIDIMRSSEQYYKLLADRLENMKGELV